MQLELEDFDAPMILAFLDHLEKHRNNSIRSRNARLAAIRSFLKYASLQNPTALPSIQRSLAIPLKRFERPSIKFLSREEIEAILDAPDPTTWCGQRDRVMFLVFYNTGARVSEIIELRSRDISLHRGFCVHLHGKGRKERTIPLWKNTVRCLREWSKSNELDSEQPVFSSRTGRLLTRSAIEQRLGLAVKRATAKCPSLEGCKISPHTIRRTTAMHLLQSGVDITVIALWLGHESPATAHIYVEADITMKERALSQVGEPKAKGGRYRPKDDLLGFLDSL